MAYQILRLYIKEGVISDPMLLKRIWEKNTQFSQESDHNPKLEQSQMTSNVEQKDIKTAAYPTFLDY